MDQSIFAQNKVFTTTLGGAILCLLYLTSIHNYLLFHSLVEIFSILVAWGIFIIAWNSRRFVTNNYLLMIGVAYLFIGFLDLLHTLSYKGMGVFTGYGANLPTQLWILARYVESISLLIAPLFLTRKVKATALLLGYLVTTVLLLMTIFYWNIFPTCYIEGTGLTTFKKLSEYVISFILVFSIIFIAKKRNAFDTTIYKLVVTSIIITIGSELAFTFYLSVYGISNFVGHFLKLVSFYLIYEAIIKTGFLKPYNLLFKDLKKTESNLRLERDHLQQALSEIKKISGLLPICASCKKIRDDKGYWNQIETYIRDRSEAEFTHGICPDCAKHFYQDHIKNEG